MRNEADVPLVALSRRMVPNKGAECVDEGVSILAEASE